MKDKRKILLLILIIGLIIGIYLIRKNALRITTEEHFLYLPMLYSSGLSTLGVQVDSDHVTQDLIIPDRVYETTIRWMEVEKYQGEYVWTDWVDRNVEWFGDNKVIINVKNTPTWARVWDLDGSPPKEEFYDDYARFLIAVCERYKPWGIEMYNEPDVGIETSDPDEQYYFGAWVEGYYFYDAGYRYGQMTKEVYPIFKTRCSNVKLIGGALVGGDNSFEFLRGMQDGGLRIDYLSFHQYVFSEKEFYNPFLYADRLRQRTTLPFILSETSLLSADGGEEHEKLKAKYIQSLKDNLPWSEIRLALIYNICGSWMNSALAPECVAGDAYKVWSSP